MPEQFVQMQRIFLVFTLLLIICPTAIFTQVTWRAGEMEVRVVLENRQDADELHRLGLKGDIYSTPGYATLFVTPEEFDLIRKKGFYAEILIPDMKEYALNFWNTRDQYHSYDEIIGVIDSLSTDYPSICKKFSYGLSVEGRQLCALKISDQVEIDENEAEIMFDGGIHGDEVGGAENLVRFAKKLCQQYGADPELTYLIDNREIWLYIMVNPDGRVNMVRYNSNGVDLNRDWGYMWAGSGSSPFYYSQVETRALRNCILENQFVIQICYHSGTEFLAYPWSYRPDSCPDKPHIHQLAGIYATTSGYPDLPYEQGYTGMYSINGSSKDAGYGTMGSIAWTMEISMDKQPPGPQIQYYYDINEPAMIEMIRYSGYGVSGTITDASSGLPVAATIYVDDFYPCYNDPVEGDYHKYLLPGNYSVTVTANGYQPLTQEVVVSSNTSTELDFALQPYYNHYAYRVIACGIPDTNFGDEARTCASLSAPDGLNYSLGKWGWIILDMQDMIHDGPGSEIIVHEGDADPEGFACYAAITMDGPWHLVGNGTGTTTFDFSQHGIAEARFLKIEDDGVGPLWGDNAGYDLDAIEVEEQPQVIFLSMDCRIEDPAGNGDHRIDPGENFELIVTLRNIGSMMLQGGNTWLNNGSEFISVNETEMSIDNLAFGDSTEIIYEMSCSSFCPAGEIFMMVLNINSNEGIYQQSFPFNFSARAIIEDWESVSFNQFDWAMGGNKPWAINFSDPQQGFCSAKSGNADDGEISSLEVTMDVIGYDDISFFSRVSSENGSDYLKFYIDNNLAGLWSGETGWQEQSYEVTPGYHTFKWSFEKDNFNSAGADAGWIDYIVFPSCNLDGTFKAIANANPHELCGPGESHLGAYVTGGSGNYSFAWVPVTGLDDPLSQFPVADITATTLFSVEVNDGSNMFSSEIEIISNPLPETPFVIQQGDSLVSDISAGNQWYSSAGIIEGATGQVFYPDSEGDYFDIILNENNCQSDTSNIIHFIFTKIEENETFSGILLYPNPANDFIMIHNSLKAPGIGKILITDLTGRKLNSITISGVDLVQDISISLEGMKNGIYLCHIWDFNGNFLVSKKILKF